MRRVYKVADFAFSVALAGDRDPDRYLKSFAPFKAEGCPKEEELFEFAEDGSLPENTDGDFLEEDRNDIGRTFVYRIDDGYRIEFGYEDAGLVHALEADCNFTRVRASLRWDDRYVATALSSMLRVVFAQAVLMHDAVSLHASVVRNDGQAFLFMGKSGTGKSTHSRMWLENVPGTDLLNDDNPIVRVVGGQALVYGSPWSGKTPCYRNANASLAGIVRLRQAPANRFTEKEETEAFSQLLPGCSVLRQDKILHEALCMTLVALVQTVCVGEMECLPDKEAAEVCRGEVLKHMKRN